MCAHDVHMRAEMEVCLSNANRVTETIFAFKSFTEAVPNIDARFHKQPLETHISDHP